MIAPPRLPPRFMAEHHPLTSLEVLFKDWESTLQDCARTRGPCYSSCCRICTSFTLYFARRPVFGFSSTTRAGFGCPTRSRAFALTALVAENFAGFFFGIATTSIGQRELRWLWHSSCSAQSRKPQGRSSVYRCRGDSVFIE